MLVGLLLKLSPCVCVATGQALRCDVFVDTIHRVEITTRTRELLLEEEPERFETLGFDEEGELSICLY